MMMMMKWAHGAGQVGPGHPKCAAAGGYYLGACRGVAHRHHHRDDAVVVAPLVARDGPWAGAYYYCAYCW